jgi:hypothetical protein
MRVQDTGGLFVAFVFTVALVLGIVCRTAIVSAIRATVPPVLDAIVLPSQPPARQEVATAPPQPAPSPAPAAIVPAATASPVRTSVRTSTAPASAVTPTTVTLATVQLANVQPVVAVRTLTEVADTGAVTPTRSLAGTTTPRSAIAARSDADHGKGHGKANDKAKANDHRGPRPQRVERAANANGAHHDAPNHGNGGRRSGR